MASTTTPVTPMTSLEAVNIMLNAIRVASVQTLLQEDLDEDAAEAKQALDNAAREVQARGWEFNTEYDLIIDPDEDGRINLPNNTSKVRSARCVTLQHRLVQRGSKLYNNKTHTDVIRDIVKVELVVYLPFEDMPDHLKAYVTALAARRFCIPKLPSQSSFLYTQEYLELAQSLAMQADNEVRDDDLGSSSPHFAAMRRR